MSSCFLHLIFWSVVFVPFATVSAGEVDGNAPRTVKSEVSWDLGIEFASGGCLSTNSCCVPHGEPGCLNATCCENVCTANDLCCLIGWSEDCVALAGILCGDTCAGTCPSEGACCESHSGGGCEDMLCCDLVCTHTPSCCEAVWSQGCADIANQICDTCDDDPPPSICPDGAVADCCTPQQQGAGCNRLNCCEIVCDLDAFCCDNTWDISCARKARDNCPNICACDAFGDFDADMETNLRDAAAFLVCFTGPGNGPVTPGCECADNDADDDADLEDFVALYAHFSTF